MKQKLTYLSLFIFCVWLALATRSHHEWFPHIVVVYGGDIIWAGMFVFFLRIFFPKATLWKLALVNYALGVADEFSQLNHSSLMVYIRSNYYGRLMFGVGFLWSDIVCYAIGTLIGWAIVAILEKYIFRF
ncbi:DUF2809 domain-containing protein [Parasediminibacterium sp. JCM 36343]|uniref:ribosomal maturation YjgA family protein n=1 Tax=Parasediminibacterium sp. JCM 36343 TaxID=3374279 RepID=UPI00397A811B